MFAEVRRSRKASPPPKQNTGFNQKAAAARGLPRPASDVDEDEEEATVTEATEDAVTPKHERRMRARRPGEKASPPPKGQAKAKTMAASVTNVSSSGGASSKEVEKLKSKLVAAEKMQAAQAKLINTLKSDKDDGAKKMKKLWEEDKLSWQEKAKAREEELEKKAEEAYAAGESNSKKVAEVQELLEMVQAEQANNERIKEGLKAKAAEDLEVERKRITALREEDQKAFDEREAELVAHCDKLELDMKEVKLQAAETLAIETSKINELWRKDKAAWAHKEEALISALRVLQQKIILKDEAIEQAERTIFAWEEDFASSVEEHNNTLAKLQEEQQQQQDAYAKLEASNQHLIGLWWKARENTEPNKSRNREAMIATLLESGSFEL